MKVRAAESTGVKVNGLTVTIRENYHSLLAEALSRSVATCDGLDSPVNSLTKHDYECCAADMEYEVFSANKVVSLYRRGMAKAVSYNLCYIVTLMIFISL